MEQLVKSAAQKCQVSSSLSSRRRHYTRSIPGLDLNCVLCTGKHACLFAFLIVVHCLLFGTLDRGDGSIQEKNWNMRAADVSDFTKCAINLTSRQSLGTFFKKDTLFWPILILNFEMFRCSKISESKKKSKNRAVESWSYQGFSPGKASPV